MGFFFEQHQYTWIFRGMMGEGKLEDLLHPGNSKTRPTRPLDSVLDPLWLLFSGSVRSDSLRPHGLQHTRPPCPPPSPGVSSNPSPLSQ